MEVGGRKLAKSLNLGSDDVHDFPCSPCAKEGKNLAAVKHCVECDENMCSTCLNQHNKFSSMKGHQLLDMVKTPRGQRPELPIQRCDKHGGKLIDVYCPRHDKVGCSTCIAVDHSTCRGIGFIPDIAKHFKSSDELQQLETAINSLQSRFINLKQNKQNDIEHLKRQKDKLLHEIKSERKKINDYLNKMEMELLNEVYEAFHIKMKSVDSDIKEVGDTLASLKKIQLKILGAKRENVSEKYVQVKLGHEEKKIVKYRLGCLENSNKIGRMWFDPYDEVSTSKNNIIGRVINYPAVEVERRIGEFDARVDSDDTMCDINDICVCKDGNIIITDYNNKRIKKMNKSYTVASYLTVLDNPFGICEIDDSLLAVTLINNKKVQFISQNEKLSLQSSFNVGDRCRGIAYNGGLIYVCCGGSFGRKEEGAGHIEVYTTDGALMKSYHRRMGCPCYITVSSLGKECYVSDGHGDALIVHMDGYKRNMPKKNTKLHTPTGVCWLNRSQVCFTGFDSKNVVLMSCDGKMIEELLTEKDGISNALSVCFEENQSRLVVSASESNKIKVYNLNISNC